ncbi:MAG: hypothetical protein SNJ53_02890 [Thermodesulfovibrionales bacterium]
MFKKLLIVLVGVFVVGVGLAQAAGFGNYGNCVGPNCNPNNPMSVNICAGTPETITGVVKNINIPGNGMVINTPSGDVTVYGIGPYWYWDRNNVARPDIGETVTAVVSSLTTIKYNVILSIQIGNESIQLRDTSTCQPLWRSGKR